MFAFPQFVSEVIQEVQNGGSIIQEEDSCVIADLASDNKEEEALVRLHKKLTFIVRIL